MKLECRWHGPLIATDAFRARNGQEVGPGWRRKEIDSRSPIFSEGANASENVSGNKEITRTKRLRPRPPYSHLALPLLEATPNPTSLALSGYLANNLW